MEISVQSNELIEALSNRLGEMTIEIETTRLALKKAQEAIIAMENEITHASNPVATIPYSHEIL